MKCRSVLLFVQTIISSAFALPDTGTPVDVMPLHVGNSWTYNYLLSTLDNFRATQTDSGIVRCVIIDSIQATDSTRWLISEHRNLLRSFHNSTEFPGDTSYAVIDSATYEIVERLDGLHHLYRNQAEVYIGISAFPWGRDFTDTTSVNRYAYVDSSDMAEFETHSSTIPYSFVYTFRFKRGLGEQTVQTRSTQYVIGMIATTNHTLLDAVIASVEDERVAPLPAAPVLLQNYPNPFNPATTIRYSLPHKSQVFLAVYNTLGQQVATLVQGQLEAGAYEVRFDGSALASGVYFYRLQAGSFVQTKELLLLR